MPKRDLSTHEEKTPTLKRIKPNQRQFTEITDRPGWLATPADKGHPLKKYTGTVLLQILTQVNYNVQAQSAINLLWNQRGWTRSGGRFLNLKKISL